MSPNIRYKKNQLSFSVLMWTRKQ